jgi:tRNA(fMet)-specific endonuclease VapC
VIHLLDTNSCVDHLRRGTGSNVTTRLNGSLPGSVILCSVVVAGLLYGARRSNNVARTLAEVQGFCSRFASLPFDDRAADEYGKIRAHLYGAGIPIGPNDFMIASIALAIGLTLVTHNVGEFGRVPGLNIEDWQGGP